MALPYGGIFKQVAMYAKHRINLATFEMNLGYVLLSSECISKQSVAGPSLFKVTVMSPLFLVVGIRTEMGPLIGIERCRRRIDHTWVVAKESIFECCLSRSSAPTTPDQV